MLEFETLDDILDFAIVQEQAAQAFYTQLSKEASNADRQLFYRTLAEEELTHEKKLRGLKNRDFKLTSPGLTQLKQSGYLDALPVHPGMDLKEVLLYGLKKEKSAKMLYSVLAESVEYAELAALFRMLAEQEDEHAAFFRKEYEAACANVKTD